MSEVVVLFDLVNYVLFEGIFDIDGGELVLFVVMCDDNVVGLIMGDKCFLVVFCKVEGFI